MFSNNIILKKSLQRNLYDYCNISIITSYKQYNNYKISLYGKPIVINCILKEVLIKSIDLRYTFNINLTTTRTVITKPDDPWFYLYCYMVQNWPDNLKHSNHNEIEFEQYFINKSHDGFFTEYELKKKEDSILETHQLIIYI